MEDFTMNPAYQAYITYELVNRETAQIKSFQMQPPEPGGLWWKVLLVTIDGMTITEHAYAVPAARRIWCNLVHAGWRRSA